MYYIGVFLVGAYQEILGDMHNLFGDTNAVHVTVDDKGYSIDQVIDGETVAEVLDYVFLRTGPPPGRSPWDRHPLPEKPGRLSHH